jgi:hypothetical protein
MDWILVVAPSSEMLGRVFFMPLAQLADTTDATHSHLTENQSIHQVFFSILLSITKIKKIYEQQKQPCAGHILLPAVADRFSP